VADFKKGLLRSSLESIESDRKELFLDNNSNITDIDPVVIFTKLRQLDVHRTKIHDLSPLGGLARRAPLLTYLNLSHTLISDVWHLRFFTSLQSLNLSNCIHVQHLWPLYRMQTLETLHIDRTRVSSLECIPLDSLRYLNAAHTRVSDLAPIANSHISELSLTGCKYITQTGFSALASLNPVWLSLSETNITSQSVEAWNWPELSRLWLDECPQFVSFPSLMRLRKLSSLSLSNTVLNSLEPLRGVNLVKLCLNGSTFPSLSPISGLDIEEILLSGAKFQLGPLDLPRLTALDISNTKDRCLLILNRLKYSPIVHLDLSYTTIVNLWPVRNFSRTLRQLDLSNTPVENITHLRKCRSLETLSLSYTKVRSGIWWVSEHLQSLQKISLEGTPLEDMVGAILSSIKARRVSQENDAQEGGAQVEGEVSHGEEGHHEEIEDDGQ